MVPAAVLALHKPVHGLHGDTPAAAATAAATTNESVSHALDSS